jgi:hypothetical protein
MMSLLEPMESSMLVRLRVTPEEDPHLQDGN